MIVIWKERYVRILSTLLMLLGPVVTLVTIMIIIVFMIAGVLRRGLVNIKALIASGTIGLLMIALGVLPWEIAEVVGIVALAVGGFAFFFFIWLPSYSEKKLREELLKVREYVRRERIKPVLRFLIRIGTVTGAILLVDVIGLWVFLFFKGTMESPKSHRASNNTSSIGRIAYWCWGRFHVFWLQRIQGCWAGSD